MMSEDHIKAKVALKTVYFKLCVDKCWVAGGSCAKPGSPSPPRICSQVMGKTDQVVMQALHHSIRMDERVEPQAEVLDLSV